MVGKRRSPRSHPMTMISSSGTKRLGTSNRAISATHLPRVTSTHHGNKVSQWTMRRKRHPCSTRKRAFEHPTATLLFLCILKEGDLAEERRVGERADRPAQPRTQHL